MTAITSFKSYTVDQIATLSTEQIKSANSAAIKTLTADQLKALSPDQIAAIGYTDTGYDSVVIGSLSGSQPLEDHHRAALAATIAVCGGIEGFAASIGRKHLHLG